MQKHHTNALQRRNLVQEYDRKIRTNVRWPEIIQTLFWCGFGAWRNRTMLLHSWYRGRAGDATVTPRIHDAFWNEKKKTRVQGWFLKNARIGPLMDIKVCRHDDRYSIEVLVQSLFQDRTASWVKIINGVDKYVTESMLTKGGEDMANARTREKPTVTLTSVSILVRERKWIEIEIQRSQVFWCVTSHYRLLRHDQNQSLEGRTEQSSTMTSSWSAGGRSSTTLRSGHLKVGF